MKGRRRIAGQTTDWRVNIVPEERTAGSPSNGHFRALRWHTWRVDFGTVIWIIVLVVAPVAAVLFAGAFGLLDQLGRGGLAMEERSRPACPARQQPRRSGPSGRPTSGSSSRPATTAEWRAVSLRSTWRPRWIA